MGGECFGHSASFLLLQILHLFKKSGESLGIVSGFVHVLEAKIVSLGFKASCELQKSQGHP